LLLSLLDSLHSTFSSSLSFFLSFFFSRVLLQGAYPAVIAKDRRRWAESLSLLTEAEGLFAEVGDLPLLIGALREHARLYLDSFLYVFFFLFVSLCRQITICLTRCFCLFVYPLHARKSV